MGESELRRLRADNSILRQHLMRALHFMDSAVNLLSTGSTDAARGVLEDALADNEVRLPAAAPKGKD